MLTGKRTLFGMLTTMKNLLIGGLLLASMYSSPAASILAGLKSGEIQDAKQVLVLLEKQAAEQKSGQKELTEFLITAIKEVYTADSQMKEALNQKMVDIYEAGKQDEAAKKWLEPNALGSTSPNQSERCRKKSKELREKAEQRVDEANDVLKEKLIAIQEAEDYLWDAGRREDSAILKKVAQTMSKQLKTKGGGLLSFWGERERKKNPFARPEVKLMPRNSEHQLKTVSGEGAFDLTRRLRRKVDDTIGKEMSVDAKESLVEEVKRICLFTLSDVEKGGKDLKKDAVFILLEEFETLAVDGVQALKWAKILEKSPSSSYQKYGQMFTKKLLSKLSMDYHDTAQTTYRCWNEAEEGKGEAFWKFYLAYSGKEKSMIRLNCSRENAAYWLNKARKAGYKEAIHASLPSHSSGSRGKRPLPDDSSWW